MLTEENVKARYAEGAQEKQQALCCPVDYQTELLKILPEEIIEKDYGCGDPSRYVEEGDVVLDLGSGGGKICYMAAQLVGESGHVHGVDMTDDMLALARKYQPTMADAIGQDRVTFHKGFIQNLAFDLDAAAAKIEKKPIQNAADIEAYESWKLSQRKQSPMIADSSISLVISNCVLNLVDHEDRIQLMNEIFRVLKPGGRVAISDIVCDKIVPEHLRQDPELWSGCISGAFHEKEFLDAFSAVGFVNVAYDKWESEPWQVVEDIEFRSVTLVATKPIKSTACGKNDVLMYVGPLARVNDSFGNVYSKGERVSVSESAYRHALESSSGSDFVGFSKNDVGKKSDSAATQSSGCCG